MKRMHEPVYAARLRALTDAIVPHLQSGDRVLDVGCGYGALGQALMNAPASPEGVSVRGLERVARGSELIPVDAYDGETMPHEDDAFDIVIIADVLHHEEVPERLLAECRRVARRYVIIKDHLRNGFLGQQRISFMDWAANAPYGVPCLYRYYSPDEWTAIHAQHNFGVVEERHTMRVYPPFVNFVFGGRLHYFAVLDSSR